MKKQLALINLLILLFVSCTNKQNKVKNSINSYLSDEFFKKNLSLTMLDLRIDVIEDSSIDTLLKYCYMNAAAVDFMKYHKENPVWYKDPLHEEKINEILDNDPECRKYKDLKAKYGSGEIGKVVIASVKGTDIDNNNAKKNFLLDNVVFYLDDNYKVLYSSLTIGNSDDNTEDKSKIAITDYIKDEFFKENLSLDSLIIQITKTDTVNMRRAINKCLINIPIDCLKGFFSDTNNTNTYDGKFKEYYENDPRYIRCEDMLPRYDSSDIGIIDEVRIKGTQVDNNTLRKNNFIIDETFLLDDNQNIVYTSFKFIKKPIE